MPYNLDKIDIGLLNSLIEDGRKSFRQIGREIKVSTPTIQARYERLVNLGFIKSITPILDLSKLDKKSKKQIKQSEQKNTSKLTLDTNQSINVICDYCKEPASGKLSVFKFAKYKRFFCCNSCKMLYKEKFGGRIRSLENHHD